jgi:hypothetical protein
VPDPLAVPPTNEDGSLRYYTNTELAQIDLQPIGVSGEGDHTTETLSPNGNGVVRRYRCNWEERYAAALVLVGAAVGYTNGDGERAVSRLLPDQYVGLPDQNWACTGVRILPFKFAGTVDSVDYGQPIPAFVKATIEATYEELPYDLLNDGGFTSEFQRYTVTPGYPGADISAESNYISFPGGILNFATPDGTSSPAGVPVPYGVGRSETVTNKNYVWKRVPLDVWGPGTALTTMVRGDGSTDNLGYINTLNLTTFDGHPPLTLKLVGVEEKLLLDPLGLSYAWDIVYKMQERAVPYGHLGFIFYDATATSSTPGEYYQVLSTSTGVLTRTAAEIADGYSLFNVREFANLWNPNGA